MPGSLKPFKTKNTDVKILTNIFHIKIDLYMVIDFLSRLIDMI